MKLFTACLISTALLASSVNGDGSESSGSSYGGSAGSSYGGSVGSSYGMGSVGSFSGSGGSVPNTAVVRFDDTSCANPSSVTMEVDGYECKTHSCHDPDGESKRSVEWYCTDDYDALASTIFDTKPYLVAQYYEDDTCKGEKAGFRAFSADGKCHVGYDGSFKVTLKSDGSAVLASYEDDECKEDEDSTTLPADKLTAQACVGSTKYKAVTTVTTPAATTATPAATTATPSTTSTGSGLRLASSLLAASLGGLAAIFL